MNRLLVLALVVLGGAPHFASAVEIKNVRPCWGPFGATRSDAKCLPGDVLFITYDIEDLQLDPKTKKASYDAILELIEGDEKGKVAYTSKTPNQVIPALGGARMPGDLYVTIGPKQKAGNYTIKLTIQDKIAKKGIAFLYPFQVLPEGFGFIRVGAQAVGFPRTHHVPEFTLVNFGLVQNKQKMNVPDAELTIRILDEKNKDVVEPAKMSFPKDLPDGTDLQKANLVRLTYPVYLNRPGRFTIEVLANDKISKTNAKLIYPLTVLDIGKISK